MISLVKPMFWGVLMYYSEDKGQVVLAEFLMPFACNLDHKNRWVRLSSIMPWDKIEEICCSVNSELFAGSKYLARFLD